MLKVSSPSSKFLGVANTWWELDEILSDKAQAHPKVRVEESAFRLPTMLITTRVMDIVHNAINEHRKTNAPISKCIRMARMDQHMRGSMAKVSACAVEYSRLRRYFALHLAYPGCFCARGRFCVHYRQRFEWYYVKYNSTVDCSPLAKPPHGCVLDHAGKNR